MHRGSMVLVALLAVAACAPVARMPTVDPEAAAREAEKQRVLAVENYVADLTRLHRIAYRILHDNAEYCGERIAAGIGIKVIDETAAKGDYAEAVKKLYGFGENQATVIAVAAGSPAERGGVRVGDILTDAGGRSYGEEAKRQQDAYQSRDEAALQQSYGEERSRDEILAELGKPVKLGILRAGEKHEFEIVPEPVCAYGYQVVIGDEVNAYADGKRIIFFTGIMRYYPTDDDLAVIVAHEIAHNHMGHIAKQRGNMAIGFVFDLIFAGIGVNTQGAFSKLAGQAFSQGFEAEADYVGLYLMARAGYPIESAPNVWRRLGSAHPGSIKQSAMASHPSTPERFVAMEKGVAEINAKIAANAALEPEMKERSFAISAGTPEPGSDATTEGFRNR